MRKRATFVRLPAVEIFLECDDTGVGSDFNLSNTQGYSLSEESGRPGYPALLEVFKQLCHDQRPVSRDPKVKDILSGQFELGHRFNGFSAWVASSGLAKFELSRRMDRSFGFAPRPPAPRLAYNFPTLHQHVTIAGLEVSVYEAVRMARALPLGLTLRQYVSIIYSGR
jgi:hypothetical protein